MQPSHTFQYPKVTPLAPVPKPAASSSAKGAPPRPQR
jgi:hypothetical protein